jgi:5-methylcytosine-specific restriction endonuclease McrA
MHKCKQCGMARGKRKTSTRCTACRNARSRRRRRRKELGQGTHTKDELLQVYLNQRASCALCGIAIPMFGPESHADHIVPLAHGGSNFICNIQYLCAKCDEDKGDSLPWVLA